MPAVTHWRDTVSALPSAPAITMPPTPGVNPAIRSNVRLRVVPIEQLSGDATLRGVRVGVVSQIMTSRSGSRKGSGRSSVASTSAKMALLAPMPSASVIAATHVNAGARPQLPDRELHIVSELFEPLGEPHVTISLSAQVHTGSFEACDVAQPADGDVARGLRVHAALDELARPHLDVKGDLLVDLLIERHAPQPRSKGALHGANSTFETPAENRFQVASFGGQLHAAGFGEPVDLGAAAEFRRAPLGLHPPPAFQAIERRIERALFNEHGLAGRVLDEPRDRVAVARDHASSVLRIKASSVPCSRAFGVLTAIGMVILPR